MNLKKLLRKVLFREVNEVSVHDIKLAFPDFFCDGLSSASSTARIHYFMNKFNFKKLERKENDPLTYYDAHFEDIRSCILIDLGEKDVGQMQPQNLNDCFLSPQQVISAFPDFFTANNNYSQLKYIANSYKIKTIKIGNTPYFKCTMEEMDRCISAATELLSSLLTLKELHSHFEDQIELASLRHIIRNNNVESNMHFGKLYFKKSAITEVQEILDAQTKALITEAKESSDDKVEEPQEETESIQEIENTKPKPYSVEEFNSEYIKHEDVLEMFQVSEKAFRRACLLKDLGCIKVGNSKFYKKDILFKALTFESKPRLRAKKAIRAKTAKQNKPKTRPQASVADKPPIADGLSLKEIAQHLDKGHLTHNGQVKHVSRALSKLKPLGIEGVDYHEVTAEEHHVRDYKADYVGETIYLFVPGRTRFDKSIVDQIKKKKQENLFAEAKAQASENSDRLVNFNCADEMDKLDCCYHLKITETTLRQICAEFGIDPIRKGKDGIKLFYRKSDMEELLFTLIQRKMGLEVSRTMLWSSSSSFFHWSKMSVSEAIEYHKSSVEVPKSILYKYQSRQIIDPLSSQLKKPTQEQEVDQLESKVSLYSSNYDWTYHNGKAMNDFLLKGFSEDGKLCTFVKNGKSIKVKTSFLSEKNQNDVSKHFCVDS